MRGQFFWICDCGYSFTDFWGLFVEDVDVGSGFFHEIFGPERTASVDLSIFALDFVFRDVFRDFGAIVEFKGRDVGRSVKEEGL